MVCVCFLAVVIYCQPIRMMIFYIKSNYLNEGQRTRKNCEKRKSKRDETMTMMMIMQKLAKFAAKCTNISVAK